LTSRIGGWPKKRLYSRVNWLTLSHLAEAITKNVMDILHYGEESVSVAMEEAKGPAAHFTGSVQVEPLFPVLDPSSTRGGRVTFAPGARSAWHPLGQTLTVTEGTGWIYEISPGVSCRLTGVARQLLDPPAIAQFVGSGNWLISKVRVSSLSVKISSMAARRRAGSFYRFR
jgi:hypothetical protein